MAISTPKTDLDRGSLGVSHVVVLVGIGLIAEGAVLPWVNKGLPVKVYVLGEQMGIERIWVRRLLVVAGVGVLVEIGRFLASDWRPVLNFVLVGIGGLIAVITVTQSPLTGSWTPGLGVYITLLGSLLIVFGAGVPIATTRFGSGSGTSQSVRD